MLNWPRYFAIVDAEPWLLERLAELNGDETMPFAARVFT
jgi:hypothetical protein